MNRVLRFAGRASSRAEAMKKVAAWLGALQREADRSGTSISSSANYLLRRDGGWEVESAAVFSNRVNPEVR